MPHAHLTPLRDLLHGHRSRLSPKRSDRHPTAESAAADPTPADAVDTAAIIAVLEAETRHFCARDLDAWAGTWSHAPYVAKLYTGETDFREFVGWDAIRANTVEHIRAHPDPIPVAPTAYDYAVDVFGDAALVRYAKQGEHGPVRETRLLVRERVEPGGSPGWRRSTSRSSPVPRIHTMHTPLGRSGLLTSRLALGTMIFGESTGRATPQGRRPRDDRPLPRRRRQPPRHRQQLRRRSLRGDRRRGPCAAGATTPSSRRRPASPPTTPPASTMPASRGSTSCAGWRRACGGLGTDYVDLLYVHCFDPVTPLDETVRALDDLVRAGKVRYLGISNFKAWQLMKAQGLARELGATAFVAAQYQYSLVKRDVEYEFADLCPSEGLGLVPWGPLGGGFLTGKYTESGPTEGRIATTPDETEESWSRRSTARNWAILGLVRDLAARHGATPSQVALAWLLARPAVATVILGARTPTQLDDNLGALDVALTDEELAALEEVSALPELYPYRMIEEYGGR